MHGTARSDGRLAFTGMIPFDGAKRYRPTFLRAKGACGLYFRFAFEGRPLDPAQSMAGQIIEQTDP